MLLPTSCVTLSRVWGGGRANKSKKNEPPQEPETSASKHHPKLHRDKHQFCWIKGKQRCGCWGAGFQTPVSSEPLAGLISSVQTTLASVPSLWHDLHYSPKETTCLEFHGPLLTGLPLSAAQSSPSPLTKLLKARLRMFSLYHIFENFLLLGFRKQILKLRVKEVMS